MLSRTSALLSGFGAYSLVQVLVLASNMLLVPYTIARVGLADYGRWTVALQVVTYIGLAQCGVAMVLPRELNKLVARGELAQAREMVNTVLHMMVYSTVMVGLLSVGAYFLLPVAVRGPMGVLLFGYTACYTLTTFAAVLIGAQDLAFYSLTAGAGAILGVAIGAALLSAGWGLYGLAWGWVVGHTLLMVTCGVRAALRHPHLCPTGLGQIRTPAALALLRAGGWLTLNALAGLLVAGPDVFLVTAYWGPVAVAAYGCTSRLAQAAGGQAAAGAAMAVPGLAAAVTTADATRRRRLLVDMALCQLAVTGLVVVVVLAVNQRFVRLWVGGGAYAGDVVTGAVVAVLLARHLNTVLLAMAYALDRERAVTLVSLLDGAATALATAALVAAVGPAGGHLGGFAVAALVTVPLNAHLLGRVIGPLAELWRAVGRWAVRFAPVAAAAYAVGRATADADLGPAGSVALLVGTAGLTAGVYAVVMYPLVRPTPVGQRLARLFPAAGRPKPVAAPDRHTPK